MTGIAVRSQTFKADTRGLRMRGKPGKQSLKRQKCCARKEMHAAFGLKAKEVSGFGVRGYFKQSSAASSMG